MRPSQRPRHIDDSIHTRSGSPRGGLPDILCATGNTYPEIEAKLLCYPFKTPNVVFRGLLAVALHS